MDEACLLRLMLESSVTPRSLMWLDRVICMLAMLIWSREMLGLKVPRRMASDFPGFGEIIPNKIMAYHYTMLLNTNLIYSH